MRKYIGIVTWYKNGNFGGTLQAFALMKTLQGLGYEALFVNYCPDHGLFYRVKRKIKNILVALRHPHSAASMQAIWRFVEQQMPQTPVLITREALTTFARQHLDACICGSDQIWSVATQTTGHYFLDFIDTEKRIAYAPSIGLKELKSGQDSFFAEKVRQIPHLSIREEIGAQLILKHTGRKSQVVVDPCLLINADQWRDLAKGSAATPKGKYILCYFIDYNPDYLHFTQALEHFTGLPVQFVATKRIRWGKVGQRVATGPLGFVNMVDQAQYVLTDSFHGLVFSLCLHTPVGVFMRFNENDPNNQNSRVENILQWIDGAQFVVDSQTNPADFLKRAFNWPTIDHALAQRQNSSLSYLVSSLQEVLMQPENNRKGE